MLITFLLAVAAVYVATCLLAFGLQERLVFFPGPPSFGDPSSLGMEFEEVWLTAGDGVRLHAWYLPAAGAGTAVLVCHGNAGTIADRLPLARAFLDMGHAVLLFDYRGYGRSEGRPSEVGTYADADAACAHLESRGIDPATRLAVFGESLGAAVAIELARRRRVAAVILESAFTSLADVGARAYPFLPVRWLSRIHYPNLDRIGELQSPVMVVHSPDDEIVPFAHGEALYAAAREPKAFLRTAGGHNDGGFAMRAAWREEVEGFLQAMLDPRDR